MKNQTTEHLERAKQCHMPLTSRDTRNIIVKDTHNSGHTCLCFHTKKS